MTKPDGVSTECTKRVLAERPRRRGLGGFLSDARGVAAIEFALLMPFLFIAYFMVFEVTLAIETRKKVDRIGSMVADLITQQPATSKAEIEAILQIGQALIQPYQRSTPVITVTAIQLSDEDPPKATVDWSRKRLSNGTFAQDAVSGTPVTVPADLKTRGSYLVKVESDLTYYPLVTWSDSAKSTLGVLSAFNQLPFDSTYFFRPRQSQTIPCADCSK